MLSLPLYGQFASQSSRALPAAPLQQLSPLAFNCSDILSKTEGPLWVERRPPNRYQVYVICTT
jgi:hypothetical protein